MANVTIFTGFACSFCERAKMLLTQKKVQFEEINIAKLPEQRTIMMARTNGARTVPQIFINDQHIGGSDDLYALEREGKLDELLANDA